MKKERPFEDILNVHTFNGTDNPTKKELKREERWARDRAEKGYCWYDLGDIDLWFMAVITNMLRDFRDHHSGWPTEVMCQEYLENKGEYSLLKDLEDYHYFGDNEEKDETRKLLEKNANARWNAILTEMADKFEALYQLRERERELPYQEYAAKRQEATDAAFDLFKKWFHCLWN